MRNGKAFAFTAVSAFAVGAYAQSFNNGDFAGGTLTGWTLTPTANGTSLISDVQPIDIDGAGPLGVSNAARLEVGQAAFISGDLEGMTFTQSMTLTAGVQYTFFYNWASRDTFTSGSNADGGVFDFIVNGASIANASVGSINALQTITGTLSGVFTPGSTGSYTVGAEVQRHYLATSAVDTFMDNFTVTAAPEPPMSLLLGLGLVGVVALRRRRR